MLKDWQSIPSMEYYAVIETINMKSGLAWKILTINSYYNKHLLNKAKHYDYNGVKYFYVCMCIHIYG